MTYEAVLKILAHIKYKDWTFRLLNKGDGFLLQTEFMAPDSKGPTGELFLQRGRKWYISSYSCIGEVVRTAYKAIEASELHEMQENFKFRGDAIFDPHLDPRDLSYCIREEIISLSVRKTSPAMEQGEKEKE